MLSDHCTNHTAVHTAADVLLVWPRGGLFTHSFMAIVLHSNNSTASSELPRSKGCRKEGFSSGWRSRMSSFLPKRGKIAELDPILSSRMARGLPQTAPPPLQEPHLGPGYSQGLRGSVPFSVPLTSDGSSAGVTPQLHTPIR